MTDFANEDVIRIPQPLGLYAAELFQRATEYLAAFVQLDGCEPSYDYPKYFLATHAIELFLKSFIAANGISKRDLARKLSHDLDAILEQSEALGLVISDELRAYARSLQAINCDYDLRYPSGFRIVAPPSTECVRVTETLREALRPVIARAQIDATLQLASDTRHLKGKTIAWSD